MVLLANRSVSAGFRFDGASVFPILNLQWDDDVYSKGLAGIIRDFVGRRNELPSEDLKEWYDEFTRLSEAGRYFLAAIVTFFERPNRVAKRPAGIYTLRH
jgi:arsenite methyltransferase